MARKTAVEQRLDDLAAKLDEWGERFEKALDSHAVRDDQQFDKHDTRLWKLEQSHAGLLGKLAVVSVVASAAMAAAAKLVMP